LAFSVVAPYLVCSPATPGFQWTAVARLAALALALGLWYRVLPVTGVTDAGFLLLIAFVMLGKYFDGIYPDFFRQRLSILGTLALFHVSALVLILERRVHETGYGFWPSRRDWLQGALHYLYFLALGAPLAFALKAAHFSKPAPLWAVLATFLGFLWVVALWEEFLFRGVLQPWLEDWAWGLGARSRAVALVVTSVVFGSAHLWFRGFPNWRWALIATVLGLLCGRARNRTGGIRAGVVTHALVVATWRAFFF
jgi:membrane protease YdiL (CAAX protease family)